MKCARTKLATVKDLKVYTTVISNNSQILVHPLCHVAKRVGYNEKGRIVISILRYGLFEINFV